MQGMMADPNLAGTPKDTAACCVQMADALIAALNEAEPATE
jgi:hypothetical protein